MREKLIIASIPVVVTAVLGILLPETAKTFLRNVAVHFLIRYIFTWLGLVALLLLVAGTYFVFKLGIAHFSKIVASLLILALGILLPIITGRAYLKFQGPPTSFTIGVCNFFVVSENGKLSNSKQGFALKQSILKDISDIHGRENNVYARIINSNIVMLNPTEFEISRHSLLNFDNFLKDNFVNKSAHIVIWGIISENAEIEKVNVSYKGGLFDEEGILKLKTTEYFKRFDTLVIKLCRNKPPLDKIQIIANLFYPIISMSPSIATASYYKDVSMGLKLLDDSQKIWNKAITTYASTTDFLAIADLVSYFEIAYDLNRASLFHNAARGDAEIESIFRILEKNLFFPLSTYEDFKKEYDLYYTSTLATGSLEIAKLISEEDARKLSFKNKLYQYEGPYFLIDYFTQLIVLNDHYDSNLRYYKMLAVRHPREPLIYLFWGDAIKMYKSERFALNLARVDPAIVKYKFAEKLDLEWPLIGCKIYVASYLQFIGEKELGHWKKVAKIRTILESYKQKRDKYVETLEVKKFFNDEDVQQVHPVEHE
jgi:hypothetical protein